MIRNEFANLIQMLDKQCGQYEFAFYSPEPLPRTAAVKLLNASRLAPTAALFSSVPDAN